MSKIVKASLVVARERAIDAWSFLPDKVVPTVEDRPLVFGKVGLHGSRRLMDALRCATGPCVAEVQIWGDVIEGDRKLCGSRRNIKRIADATETLHRFACDVAERVLNSERQAGREPLPLCWDLLAAKRSWLNGVISSVELDAIRVEEFAYFMRVGTECHWDIGAWEFAFSVAYCASLEVAWEAAWGVAWDAGRAAVFEDIAKIGWEAQRSRRERNREVELDAIGELLRSRIDLLWGDADFE